MIGGVLIALDAWGGLFLACFVFLLIRYTWEDASARRRIARLIDRERERDMLEDEYRLPTAPNPRWLA